MKCPKCNSDNPDTQQFCGKCGTKLIPVKDIAAASTKSLITPRVEFTTGFVFAGRYQIVEMLGEGGMGKVYKVIDKQLNEEIALKLIKPEIASDKKTIKRFSNELKLSRKISHRNVGRMYELMEDKGSLFITMEYVPGQDLKGLIGQSGRLATGTAISIAKQICEGLAEAHQLGVIHRDLKSNNIMVDKCGNVRIMDFGIARSLTEKSITRAGAMIGTPEYMSPEQAEAEELDQRSDIYSLGVILYEMVTGQLPFEGDTPLSVAMKHKGEIPRDPKELNPQIPADLSRLILKCLEKDKGSRYQDAEELGLELDNIEMSIPTIERVVPRKKTTTSKEITVTVNFKRFLIFDVIVATLIIGGAIFWKFLQEQDSIPSIAVLTFENLSPSKEQEYFCEGLRESIIRALKQVRNLRVPATIPIFKNGERDYRQIGQKLKVATVLDGSVQKVEDKVRIMAQLIDITDGSVIWSEKFDPEQQDIFTIQDKISMSIVNELKVNLLGEEESKIKKRYTKDTKAWELYLCGRHFWNKRTEDGFNTAITFFEQAIKQDPNYALAHAGLADCYVLLGHYAYQEPNETFPKAKEHAQKALSIDDTLAEAHASLAYIATIYEWNWELAETEFKEAIKLNPNYATAYHWYSVFLFAMDRCDESYNQIIRARELDPHSIIINTNIGWPYYFSRQYDKAIEAFNNTLLIEEGFWYARWGLAVTYFQKKQYEKALMENQRAKDLYKSWQPQIESSIGITHAYMGQEDKTQQVLDNLLKQSKQRYVPRVLIADLYLLGLKDYNKGFEWLKKAVDKKEPGLTWLKVNPFYDPIRSDPRYTEILRMMKLDD